MLYVKVKPSMKSIKIMPSKANTQGSVNVISSLTGYWSILLRTMCLRLPLFGLSCQQHGAIYFFNTAIFQTTWIIVEILFMVILYILIIVLFLSNLTISLFLFRRQSTLRRMRELKAMLDEFRRERDEVINMISSKEEQRWLRLSSLLSFYP